MQRTDELRVDEFETRMLPGGNGWAVVGQGGNVVHSGSPRQCEDWLDAWENRRPQQLHASRRFELVKRMAGAVWAAMSKPFTPQPGLSKAA